MSRLIFNYAVMNSGKSLHLLQVNHNYKVNNKKTLLLKSSIDDRSKAHNTIESRLGVREEAILIYPSDNPYTIVESYESVNVVLIDEVQFLSKEQVYQLSEIVDKLNITVIAYGLKVDAFGNLF